MHIPGHIYECIDFEHIPQFEQHLLRTRLCLWSRCKSLLQQNRVILGTNKREHQTRVQLLTQRQAFVLNRNVMPLNARMTPCLLQQSYQRRERFWQQEDILSSTINIQG
jgi:hypothetical protein